MPKARMRIFKAKGCGWCDKFDDSIKAVRPRFTEVDFSEHTIHDEKSAKEATEELQKLGIPEDADIGTPFSLFFCDDKPLGYLSGYEDERELNKILEAIDKKCKSGEF